MSADRTLSAFRIPIHLSELAGFERPGAGARVGVPFPRGLVSGIAELAIVDDRECVLPWQARVQSSWPDRSIRWLLVDLVVACAASATTSVYLVRRDESLHAAAARGPSLRAADEDGRIVVETSESAFEFHEGTAALMSAARYGGTPVLDHRGLQVRLSDPQGVAYDARVSRLTVEAAGPVRVDIVGDGRFGGEAGCPLEFEFRWTLFAGSTSARCEFVVRNPCPARHAGGLWDLGDPGSWRVGDLSLRASPGCRADGIGWYAEHPEQLRHADAAPWSLYQDSSGGERWDSPNHVEADGRSGVRFRGYEVRAGADGDQSVVESGLRAQPCLAVHAGDVRIAVVAEDFWQNFPKALRWRDGEISVGLFPHERLAPTEIQGGEQKRHVVWFEFGPAERASTMPAASSALHAWVDPKWVEASGAVPGFVASLDAGGEYLAYVGQIVDGPRSFFARREIVDEYGWRHFGDLYADHEAVGHVGTTPFVSHYNNQYDFVLGAGVHALRTGNPDWLRLMADAARHTIDIDVYHTRGDRSAFNGGLFWHTDHYLPAATATHRTYSRRNAANGQYGGGPSNEHNYASGLLLYYYMTGDAAARKTVIGLADWVLAMDDGATTLLGLFDDGPTGAASRTADEFYHGPGRGPGNSISTLLDAYRLTHRRDYVRKAEELIQRCIHPRDDVPARQLDEPERRWSYLVFLQVLGKYLDTKLELGETGYEFQYARESLLRYASYMLEHEVPYRDVLHKVELPTETWSAHDIRKCHVFHLAARYDDSGLAERFRERAAFFYERCIRDLASFETSWLTRPLVILCVFGFLHEHYVQSAGRWDREAHAWAHDYDFGEPSRFLPQRARVRSTLRAKASVAASEVRRIVVDRIAAWLSTRRRA